MKNKTYKILFGILLVFLFLPILQEHTNLFKVKALRGVSPKTEFPMLSLDSFKKGKYQLSLENYTSENMGFREPAIRLYNQYLWTFYKKTYNNSFAHGKGNWFYYWAGVDEYYGKELYKWFDSEDEAIENYEKNISMMCELREILYSKKAGEVVEVILLRNDDEIRLEIELM